MLCTFAFHIVKKRCRKKSISSDNAGLNSGKHRFHDDPGNNDE
jgi:hypothetical protein